MMEQLLENKVVLVTGGNSGIGKSAALAFAREGAKIVVAGRNVERLKETIEQIKNAGGESIFVQADVAKEAEVEAMLARTIDTFGRLDCAFNNAGGYSRVGARRAPLVELLENDWDRTMDVNLKGVWLCMKYEIPEMLKVGGGAIVNTSSVDALRGEPFVSPYCASKSGLFGLMKSTVWEYGRKGIRINLVCPGLIRTPPVEGAIQGNPEHGAEWIDRTALGRLGEPEEIAEAVVWLCSDASSFITGHAMVVDGGYLA